MVSGAVTNPGQKTQNWIDTCAGTDKYYAAEKALDDEKARVLALTDSSGQPLYSSWSHVGWSARADYYALEDTKDSLKSPCRNAARNYFQEVSGCKQKQRAAEEALCAANEKSLTECGKLDECYERTQVAYTTARASLVTNMARRKKEVVAVRKVLCLANLLTDDLLHSNGATIISNTAQFGNDVNQCLAKQHVSLKDKNNNDLFTITQNTIQTKKSCPWPTITNSGNTYPASPAISKYNAASWWADTTNSENRVYPTPRITVQHSCLAAVTGDPWCATLCTTMKDKSNNVISVTKQGNCGFTINHVGNTWCTQQGTGTIKGNYVEVAYTGCSSSPYTGIYHAAKQSDKAYLELEYGGHRFTCQ